MLGCVMRTVNMPDYEANGSKQKRSVWYRQLKDMFNKLVHVLAKKHAELNNVLYKSWICGSLVPGATS